MQNKSLNNKVLVSLLAMSCVYMGGLVFVLWLRPKLS